MILTHGANSLDNNVIYQFNLDKFDTQTLKDGDRQWKDTSGRLTFTKASDGLVINFTSGTKQYFSLVLPEFSTLPKFRVRGKWGGSLPYQSFFGFAELSLYGGNGSIPGFWRKLNGNWSTVFQQSLPAPNTVDMTFTRNDNKFDVDVFRNGSYVGTTQCDHSYDTIHHNVDYNGSSNNGTIKLYELLITKE